MLIKIHGTVGTTAQIHISFFQDNSKILLETEYTPCNMCNMILIYLLVSCKAYSLL